MDWKQRVHEFKRRPRVRQAGTVFLFPTAAAWAVRCLWRDPEVRRDPEVMPMPPRSWAMPAYVVSALVWAPLVVGVVWLLW